MFSKAKYIIVANSTIELPYVFPELVKHSDLARLVTKDTTLTVVGAGFCHVSNTGSYECYGDSSSLGVKSREEDSDLLNRMLGGVVTNG